MWFEELMGFSEDSPDRVRSRIRLDGPVLESRVNGRKLVCGKLETPTLAELRRRVQSSEYEKGPITLREVIADVRRLHAAEHNAGALFQVASQFNLLEMVSPSITPERGVGIYENDRTQGPACAIAAGAGTIYRNYFAEVNGRIGQSADHQIDCLAGIGAALGNSDNRLWEMRNGYALVSEKGLHAIRDRLRRSEAEEIRSLRDRLRIGLQWNTQVTETGSEHLVSQAYCSALPVSYCRHASYLWEEFASLVLEAAYEATILAGISNMVNHGDRRIFLTLLGGGAFGNELGWILGAMEHALAVARRWQAPLELGIVSYGSSNPEVRRWVDRTSEGGAAG